MPEKTACHTERQTESSIKLPAALAAVLPKWYRQVARPLPWRRDSDPYHVWVSEIMLQQTRAEVVRSYYLRFLKAFPTLASLAQAHEEKLMKLWEGLGYYSRARNLQKAARIIAADFGGIFPGRYDELLRLPGVGSYTAGAIASICFSLPCPAVDGNVMRIIARIMGISVPVDTPRMKADIAAALEGIYPKENPGVFTQSLMELGATVCLPNGMPKCAVCPVKELCFAYQNRAVTHYPIKSAKKEKRVEKRTVLALICGSRIAVRRRASTGLLADLWELPNTEGTLSAQEALDLAAQWRAEPVSVLRSADRTHVFTHIKWEMTCYYIECRAEPPSFVWAEREELSQVYALPSAFRLFLK